MDLRPASTSRKRRTHGATARHRQVVVRFADDELDAVRSSAARAGLAVGAWLGDLAVRTSGTSEWQLAVSRQEVVRQLVRVRLDLDLVSRAVAGSGDTSSAGIAAAAVERLDALIDGIVAESG